MKKTSLLILLLISLCCGAKAQLLMDHEFTGLSNGNLSGQGTWTTVFNNTIRIDVANSSPLVGCGGLGGSYATSAVAATFTTERLSFPTTNFTANADQVFFLSFLLNISATGSNDSAHIISMGNDFGGTQYEFARVHTRPAGAGYNIGLSEGGGTGLGARPLSGINWGTTVLNLNSTYLFVLRYDYDNGGGANADATRIWVNPAIYSGSAPVLADVQASILAGTLGNDILFDGDNVRNIYLNNGMGGPAYKIDAIKYARGATASAAWTNIGITATCFGLPVNWLETMVQPNSLDQPTIFWKVEEKQVSAYSIERSTDGVSFTTLATLPASGNGLQQYQYTDQHFSGSAAIYRIKQIDVDGRFTYSKQAVFNAGNPAVATVYPNPVRAQATVQVAANLVNTQAVLYDVFGKQLKRIRISNNTVTIAMDAYPSGIYYLKLATGKLLKLIKE